MASAPFLVPIDLNNLEIQNVKLQNISGEPTVGVGEGSIFIDTAVHRPKWHNGTAFQSIYPFSVTENGKAVLRDSNGDFTANTITANLTGNVSGNAGTVTNGVYTTGSYSNPAWITALAGSKITGNISGNAAAATNLLGGTVGQIAYQSAADTTTFLSAGTSGQLLTSAGAAAPAWVNKDTIKLNQLGSPTADLDLNGYAITNSATTDNSSADNTLATCGYVRAVAQSLDVKGSVKVSTTANLTSLSGLFTLNGVTLQGNYRVLVKDQTDKKENGIYLAQTGAWTRAEDMDAASEVPGAFTFVEGGTTFASTGWVATATVTGLIGTFDITWTQFSGAGTYTAGRGIVQNGTAFNFAQDSNYTAGQIPYASSTTAIGFKDVTGTGNVVLATAPTVTGLITDTLTAVNSGGKSTISIGDTAANTYSQLLMYGGSTKYNWSLGAQYNVNNSFEITPSTAAAGTTFTNPVYKVTYDGIHTFLDGAGGTRMTLNSTGLGIGVAPVSGFKFAVEGKSVFGISSSANGSVNNWNVFKGIGVSDGTNVYGSYGGFILNSNTNFTSGARRYLITNAFDSNKFAIIRSADASTDPALGTNGALTSGTADLILDSAGNLGIGDAPGSKLDVRFPTNPAVNNGSGSNVLRVWTSAAFGIDVGGAIGFGGKYDSTNYQSFGQIAGRKSNATSGNNAGYLEFATCDAFGTMAAQAYLNSTGLGIGASPSYKLDVAGAGRFSVNNYPQIIADSANSNGVLIYLQEGGVTKAKIGHIDSVTNLQFNADGGSSPQLTLTSSGNLGLGVAPLAWQTYKAISVGGTGTSVFGLGTSQSGLVQGAFYNNGSGSGWGYSGTSQVPTYYLQINGENRWHIATSGSTGSQVAWTQAMTLDASGNLAIGVASASYRLDVQNSAGDSAAQIKSGTANVGLVFDYVNNYGTCSIRKSGTDKWLYGVIGDSSSTPSYKIQSGSGVVLTLGYTGAATFAGTVTAQSSGTANGQVVLKKTIIGAGTGTSFTVTHNFANTDVIGMVRKVASPYDTVYCDMTRDAADPSNKMVFTFASSQTLSDFWFTVMG